MKLRIAEVVDWGDLRDTIVVSLIAGVGLTAAYGFLLVGYVRASEYHEQGDTMRATLYGLVGVAGLAVTLGGIVAGLIFIAKK